MVLSPLITFIAYSVVGLVSHGAPFSVTKAVTSLSILSLMNTPARRLLFAIPFGLQAVGSFDRIEKFLQLDENPELLVSSTHNSEKGPEPGAEQDMGPTSPYKCSQHVPAIHVKSAAFGWEADAPPVVTIGDIDFARGSFTVITGPIGCGKSTLLKGLLLETPYVRGTVQVSTGDVAYCGQTPWTHEGTIRDNIVGESEFDASWYNSVIASCELDFDLRRMTDGDTSMVGSRGLSISGGQRQRIVCAIPEAKLRTYALSCVTDEFSPLLELCTPKRKLRFLTTSRMLLMLAPFVPYQTRSSARTECFVPDAPPLSWPHTLVSPAKWKMCLSYTEPLGTPLVQLLQAADQVILMSRTGEILDCGPYEEVSKHHSIGEHHEPLTPSAALDLKTGDQINLREFQSRLDTQLDTRMNDLRRQRGDWRSYALYIGSLGWLSFSLFLVGAVIHALFTAFFQVWVTWWAEDTAGRHEIGYWLGLYATWGVLIMLALLCTPM